jgi:hypothetical protein
VGVVFLDEDQASAATARRSRLFCLSRSTLLISKRI